MRTRVSVFDAVNYAILIGVIGLMLYPFWHVVMGSFMTGAEFLSKSFLLYPAQPTLENYQYLLTGSDAFLHVRNSAIITLVGTGTSLFITSATAYGLAKRYPGSRFLMWLVVGTMFIYPGLIPVYINFKNLGLINTWAVLVIFPLVAPFFLIIMRSNYQVFPQELLEAAKMDGYNEFAIYFRIVLPLSKAILAAVGLFIAVSYWNLYLPSVFFITDSGKKTMQDYLAELLREDIITFNADTAATQPLPDVIKMAAIVVGGLPIMAVYPFLQKYFVQGALIGAVKG